LTSSFNFVASLSSSFKLSFVVSSLTDEERSSLAGFSDSKFGFSRFILEAIFSNPLDSYQKRKKKKEKKKKVEERFGTC
jgi:predicted nucleic acid-binding protein